MSTNYSGRVEEQGKVNEIIVSNFLLPVSGEWREGKGEATPRIHGHHFKQRSFMLQCPEASTKKA